MSNKGYSHLTYDQRCQIYTLKSKGFCHAQIARDLKVHSSTISREVKRNLGARGYRHKQAHEKAVKRRVFASSKGVKLQGNLLEKVESHLRNEQWSPEQTAGRLKRDGELISHETIYKHIWADKKKGGDLYKHLRHRGKKYNKRGAANAGRGLIPDRVDIDQRPKIVEEKSRFGDFEIDTIIGKNHKGAIVSLVDRCTKLTLLTLLPHRKADAVTEAISKSCAPLKIFLKTMTADNGKEFAGHKNIAESLGLDVYFAKPYRSWERGLNEHTNGLVRQYLPKKTPFDTVRQDEVKGIQNLLNNRPRKILGFKTPLEACQELLDPHINIALHT